MNKRIEFLKAQTLSGANKIARAPIVPSELDTSREPASIPVKKAMAIARVFERMPMFIGEGELIVGTRTLFTPHKGNEDGGDRTLYSVETFHKYLNDEEIARFGKDYSRTNKQHYTPDLGIVVHGGIGALIERYEARLNDTSLGEHNRDFLHSVIIVYRGLSRLVSRYAEYAAALAEKAEGAEYERLMKISEVCTHISLGAPRDLYEAIQLLWFAHLGTIVESGRFICYGRLDVILGRYVGDMSDDEALLLIECLLLKMYDQADIKDGSSIAKHEGQLVVTLGGVLPNGESAYNRVTKLFLRAIGDIMLPDPEFNLRISKKNPPEFLDMAAALTVRGANFVSYYNDDLFVESLIGAGIPVEYARDYAFDLCQDINIPGMNDSWCAMNISLVRHVLRLLDERCDFESFDELLLELKVRIVAEIDADTDAYNKGAEIFTLARDGKLDEYFEKLREWGSAPTWFGRSPACPMPYLSGMYHGTLEAANDMIYDTYPLKHKGAMVGAAVEGVNSLAAIKKVVFDDKKYTLSEVYGACKSNFEGMENTILRKHLQNAPKWGNDDEFVDRLAKEILEFCLLEFTKRRLFDGGRLLSGIHQPHPVTTGYTIGATPDGRGAGEPIAVTMTPANGTMKCGATAALRSASIFDPMLLQWNYCFMINYYSSVFEGDGGKEKFKQLLKVYFNMGGMQHQPNILDKDTLVRAQNAPEEYKDLIVRLWGVSAHFVDLPRDIQNELIERL